MLKVEGQVQIDGKGDFRGLTMELDDAGWYRPRA